MSVFARITLHDLRDMRQTRCMFLGDKKFDFLENVHNDDYEAFQNLIGSTKTLLWIDQGREASRHLSTLALIW